MIDIVGSQKIRHRAGLNSPVDSRQSTVTVSPVPRLPSRYSRAPPFKFVCLTSHDVTPLKAGLSPFSAASRRHLSESATAPHVSLLTPALAADWL